MRGKFLLPYNKAYSYNHVTIFAIIPDLLDFDLHVPTSSNNMLAKQIG